MICSATVVAGSGDSDSLFCLLSKERFTLKKIQLHTIQSNKAYYCHWLPTKSETSFCSTCLELFLGFPGYPWFFWLVAACSGLSRLVPGRSVFHKRRFHRAFWLENLLKINFMLYYITKWGSFYVLQSRASVIVKWSSFFYKTVGQVVLQVSCIASWAGIAKWDNFYYKVRQVLLSWAIITN